MLLALAISTMVYTTALALASAGVAANNQFLCPTVKGRIEFSAAYADIWISRVMYRIFLSSSFVKERIDSWILHINMWITFLLFPIMESPNHKEVITIGTI